jgi:hypothetical protein
VSTVNINNNNVVLVNTLSGKQTTLFKENAEDFNDPSVSLVAGIGFTNLPSPGWNNIRWVDYLGYTASERGGIASLAAGPDYAPYGAGPVPPPQARFSYQIVQGVSEVQFINFSVNTPLLEDIQPGRSVLITGTYGSAENFNNAVFTLLFWANGIGVGTSTEIFNSTAGINQWTNFTSSSFIMTTNGALQFATVSAGPTYVKGVMAITNLRATFSAIQGGAITQMASIDSQPDEPLVIGANSGSVTINNMTFGDVEFPSVVTQDIEIGRSLMTTQGLRQTVVAWNKTFPFSGFSSGTVRSDIFTHPFYPTGFNQSGSNDNPPGWTCIVVPTRVSINSTDFDAAAIKSWYVATSSTGGKYCAVMEVKLSAVTVFTCTCEGYALLIPNVFLGLYS